MDDPKTVIETHIATYDRKRSLDRREYSSLVKACKAYLSSGPDPVRVAAEQPVRRALASPTNAIPVSPTAPPSF